MVIGCLSRSSGSQTIILNVGKEQAARRHGVSNQT